MHSSVLIIIVLQKKIITGAFPGFNEFPVFVANRIKIF